MNVFLIYGLGFLSQILFFARNIAQWFLSEKEGKVISPAIYWQISLAASVLMFIYGVLRNDFAIVLGQMIVYAIYIRNLQLKRVWRKMHLATRLLAMVIPLLCIGWLFFGDMHNLKSIIKNEDVPLFIMIWGSAGQIIFTFRFIYQWIYSEKRSDSFLPLGFWIISTVGSLMIFSYAIYRLDPVLFAAHSIGIFVYVRNILLHAGRQSIFSKIDKIPVVHKLIKNISEKMK
ncbi:MAG: lauroyl acyltransferase [Bacteroidales bacterium]|nr:lauroyl acyltransferase [Bacteroidales bacterium]